MLKCPTSKHIRALSWNFPMLFRKLFNIVSEILQYCSWNFTIMFLKLSNSVPGTFQYCSWNQNGDLFRIVCNYWLADDNYRLELETLLSEMGCWWVAVVLATHKLCISHTQTFQQNFPENGCLDCPVKLNKDKYWSTARLIYLYK